MAPLNRHFDTGLKMKPTAWTLVLLVLVAQATAQKTTKATTPKPIACNKATFKDIMTPCCGTPIGTVAADEYLADCKTCAGITAADKDTVEWINYYKWNVLMSADNKTDLKSAANLKILCRVAPFINCLFKDYFIQSHGALYGYEASQAMNKTNPSRDESYAYFMNEMITEYDGFYTDGTIPTNWNGTIDCPVTVAGKKKTKAVYLGNLFLTQYWLTNMYYQCPDPKEDATCVYKWERFMYCHNDIEQGFEYQRVKTPQWLTQLKQKNQLKANAFLAKLRQKL